MAKLQGNGGGKDAADEQVMMDDRQRRYNSQFNPEIARRPIRRDERDGRF
jgi:hypothetical protein